MSEKSPHIVIIGGGASGTLVAANLLRLAPGPLAITLVERQAQVARGVAYSAWSDDYLLNVPVEKMGAFPDEPEGFFKWVEQRRGLEGVPTDVVKGAFLPRRLYGAYLADVLEAARSTGATKGVTVQVTQDEAIDIQEMPSSGAKIELRTGRQLDADLVVLALGNLPGEYPLRKSTPFYHGPRYLHQPWSASALDGIRFDQDVLVVGMGLTAIDVILTLERRGFRGTVHSLSRRGLRPQVHAPNAPVPPFLDPAIAPRSIRLLVKRVRKKVREVQASGGNWRAVIDALRPVTPQLWAQLDWTERARFMRHVRPFWDIHRHRLAPSVHARVEAMVSSGRLLFHAGRIEELREIPGAAQVAFRRRGTQERITLTVDKVINCTGPRSDYSKYQHPLFVNLLARGLIDHDPLALGIAASERGEVYRYRGPETGWMFTLGTPLKGTLWECTAMPEIRAQAPRLAALLIERLGATTPAAGGV